MFYVNMQVTEVEIGANESTAVYQFLDYKHYPYLSMKQCLRASNYII